jgi:hypothetical protein
VHFFRTCRVDSDETCQTGSFDGTALRSRSRKRRSSSLEVDTPAEIAARPEPRPPDPVSRAAAPRAGADKASPSIPIDWVQDDSPVRLGYGAGNRHGSYFRRRYGSPLDVVSGPLGRFVLASLVLIGFGMWWSNNGGVAVAKQAADMVGSRREVTLTAARKGVLQAIETQREFEMANPTREPLRIRHLPDALCDAVGSWNGVFAGGLLLLSIFFVGRAMAVGVALAAAIALFGHSLPVSILADRMFPSIILAVSIWAIAIIFFRQTVDA